MSQSLQTHILKNKGYSLFVNPRIWNKHDAITRIEQELAYDTDYGVFSNSDQSNPFIHEVTDDLHQLHTLQHSKDEYAWLGHHGFTTMPKNYHILLSSKQCSEQDLENLE